MSPRTNYRFSLRGLLGLVTAISVVLGTYSLFEVVGVTLALAGIGSVMYLWGLEYNLTRISVYGLFLALVTSLLTVAFVFSWLTLGQGPVFFRSGWPPALQTMAAYSSAPLRIKVRRDTRYNEYDVEFHWRVPMRPTQHEAMVYSDSWETISASELPPDFLGPFPALWRPRHRANSLYHRRIIDSSDRYEPAKETQFSIYDPQEQLLYVRYRVGN